ncbi:MAG: hypothetical protein WAO76_07665 [Georgfuchsia sp.]
MADCTRLIVTSQSGRWKCDAQHHGRLEVRRCWAFAQLESLSAPRQWVDLEMFGVIETERTINGKTSHERRLVLNLFRLDASKRKGGIHTRRILAASSDSYREALLGLCSV